MWTVPFTECIQGGEGAESWQELHGEPERAMLYREPDEKFLKMSDYDQVVVTLFRSITEGFTEDNLPEELPFATADIKKAAAAAAEKGCKVGNPYDVKYTYDARRPLPSEIVQLWPVTWLAVGKGRYKFKRTKRQNLIDLSRYDVQECIQPDHTPPFIANLLGRDEQANFTRVRFNQLINAVVGFQTWPLQGHLRTTVSYGQIEVDEVYAGLDGIAGTLIPISGKGGQDRLSWSQALNLNTYGAEKAPIKGLAVKSIGLWAGGDGSVWIVEFTPHLEIDDIEIVKVRRYTFMQQPFAGLQLPQGGRLRSHLAAV